MGKPFTAFLVEMIQKGEESWAGERRHICHTFRKLFLANILACYAANMQHKPGTGNMRWLTARYVIVFAASYDVRQIMAVGEEVAELSEKLARGCGCYLGHTQVLSLP